MSLYEAEMRAKFAREALLDLPATATPAERQAAERRAAITRQDHARAALDVLRVIRRERDKAQLELDAHRGDGYCSCDRCAFNESYVAQSLKDEKRHEGAQK